MAKISRRAEADIEAAVRWWRENREKAPFLLEDELERAIVLLDAQPGLGVEALDVKTRAVSVRRFLLRRSQRFLYYRVGEDGVVEILRLWSADRGKAPDL
ncbi:MAG: hypothetical protein AMXMBFR34_10270 [Myxococcaceae bacterium]